MSSSDGGLDRIHDVDDIGNPAVRLCEIVFQAESCGFNVTKTKWDPYPWVSSVEEHSPAATAGVQPGDCLLEVNGEDILGLRVGEVASRIRTRGHRATVMLWNPGIDPACNSGMLCSGPMPANLQRLVKCMRSIIEALECPVCLETTCPPAHQCVNGHLICVKCRTQTDKCPVCRVRIFRGRSLLCDQVFEAMTEAFDLPRDVESTRAKLLAQKLYGTQRKNKKPDIKINFLSPTKIFANKLLGKSSSVENLSYIRDTECNARLMTKSQSSSEICRASMSGSALSSRPGSGLLLDASETHGGSAIELRTRVMTDIQATFVSSVTSTRCLMAPSCEARVAIGQLKRHLDEQHRVPLLHYCRCQVELNQRWLHEAIVVLECFSTMFFVRCVPCKRIWVWTIDEATAQYTATININNSTSHCDVIPLLGEQTTDIECDYLGVSLESVHENATCVLTIQQSSANLPNTSGDIFH